VINPHARSALTPTADLPFELNCITTSGGIYERETGFLSVFFLVAEPCMRVFVTSVG